MMLNQPLKLVKLNDKYDIPELNLENQEYDVDKFKEFIIKHQISYSI